MDILETKLRSIVKTLSWRVTGTFCTFCISLRIIGDISASSTIAIIQLLFNTVVFYFHERVWNLISWGKSLVK
ncbi:MAG: hypothetical protein CL532_05860 [Aestuariivita sp.]|nr:hypothetical protein [Aestuariivita sp.]